MYPKQIAAIGDKIKGDGWPSIAWEELKASDGFKDSSYPGCQFRVLLDRVNVNLGVNIKVTGRPNYNGYTWEQRCKIEVPGDGEPGVVFGGILYKKNIEY